MKRRTSALICGLALPLAFAAQAGAHTVKAHHDQGGWLQPETIVAGTITNVSGDSITANAVIVAPPHAWGGWGPGHFRPYHLGRGGFPGGWNVQTPGQTTQPSGASQSTTQSSTTSTAPSTTPASVTITTDSSTHFVVDGNSSATAADLKTGQKFEAELPGSPSEGLSTLTKSAAQAVVAITPPTPPQPYAFVGTVTATGNGTVTVNVTQSLPNGLFTGSQTFDVGDQTLVIGGDVTSIDGGSLSDVKVGDVVAGGEIAPAGETAAQIEQSPLKVLVDFPAAASSGTATTTTTTATSTPATVQAQVRKARAKALNRAEKLLKAKVKQSKKSKKH